MSSGLGHTPLPHSVPRHWGHGHPCHPSTHPHTRRHSHNLLPQLAGVIVNSELPALCYCSELQLPPQPCVWMPSRLAWLALHAEGGRFQGWPGEGWRPASFLLLGSLYGASWELQITVLGPEWGHRR